MNIVFMPLPVGVNRPGELLKPIGIVVHETATPGASARNIRNYFANHPDAEASAHYAVDVNEIIQMIPEDEVAWHAGPTANHRYLSVEMCHYDDPGRFGAVWENTVEFVAQKCRQYGWGTANVFSHDWVSRTFHETDHTDPIGYFQSHGKTWTDFLAAVQLRLVAPTFSEVVKGGKPKMNPQDAQKIINILGQIWNMLPEDDKRGKDEVHRLANELRKAAGLPVQD